MINPIVKKPEDIDYKILASHLKRVSVALKVSNAKKNYYDEIEIRSILPNTTVNIDVASETRRTASIVFRGGKNSDAIKKLSIANAYSCEFELFIGYKAFINKKWTETRWYPQGLFIANQRNTVYDPVTDTMTLSLSDKYCTLNGDRGGILNEKEIVINAEKGVNISEIIFNAAGLYGNVHKFDIDAVGKEYTADGKVLESYYNGVSYEQLPYDLNYNENQTVSALIAEARDVRPGWQTYFDENGVFCCKRIPQYIDDPIELNITPEYVISENRTIDNNSIHNSVTVYGGDISSSVSFTKDNLDDSDDYKVDLGKYCDIFIYDIKCNRHGNLYDYELDLVYTYKDDNDIYYPVQGIISFTGNVEKPYIHLQPPDIHTLDPNTGTMKPKIMLSNTKNNNNGYIFYYNNTSHKIIIDNTVNWIHQNDIMYSRSYKFDNSNYETMIGSTPSQFGFMSEGNMFATDMPIEMLELKDRIPDNDIIVIGGAAEPTLRAYPLYYVRFTTSGKADIICVIHFTETDKTYNKDVIIDKYTKYDGVIGGYIYKVVRSEVSENVKHFYVDYVCPIATPKATIKDLNPKSPYNVYNNEEYETVFSGGEYEQIFTYREAYERAQYELWAASRINNSISLSCIDIPWLNVNKKVGYSLLSTMNEAEDNTKQYITQTIKRDISNGTMDLTMTSFYPAYPDLSYNKTNKL